MNFLIVDDSRTMRYLVQKNLKAMGVKDSSIVMTESGEQAVDIIRNGSIDFVLLDWHMGGMTGIDVLKAVKGEMGKRIPMIMLTTEQKRQNIRTAIECGADDYMVKPIDSTVFRKKILALTRRYGQNVVDIRQAAPKPVAHEPPEEEEKAVSQDEWSEVQATIARLEENGELGDIGTDVNPDNPDSMLGEAGPASQ